jgi:hypothetical protein
MRKFPGVHGLMFTKSYDIGVDFSRAPENLSVVLSTWPGMELPGASYEGLPKSWLGDDPRAPGDGIKCSGLCWACSMCWDLRSSGKDVILKRH